MARHVHRIKEMGIRRRSGTRNGLRTHCLSSQYGLTDHGVKFSDWRLVSHPSSMMVSPRRSHHGRLG